MSDLLLKDRLHMILSEQNHTPKAFAEKLGISSNYVYKLLSGNKTVISLTIAKLINSKFHYNIEWILNGSGEKLEDDTNLQYIMEKIAQMDCEKLQKVKEFIDKY